MKVLLLEISSKSLDWDVVIKTFISGAFPWFTQFKKLPVHLNPPGIKARIIFNFFASLFSMVVFLKLNSESFNELLNWPPWWVFILLAFFGVMVYVALFIYKKDNVALGYSKWVVVSSCFVYICIFCTLTAGFGLLNKFNSQEVLRGKLIDGKNDQPVSDSSIELKRIFANKIISKDKVTNSEGEFVFVFPKNEDILSFQIRVRSLGYSNITKTAGNVESLKSVIHVIKTRPNPPNE